MNSWRRQNHLKRRDLGRNPLYISILAIFSLIIPLGTLMVQAAETATPACPSLEQRPFNLKQVAKGVYLRKGRHETFTKDNLNAIANIGFIIGDTSVAVIDTGGSFCDGSRFHKALRQVTDKPISHVINTHVHPDHNLGNAAFVNGKSIFIGHKNLPRAVADKGQIYIENITRIVGKDAMAGTISIPPSVTVTDEMKLNLGNRPLTLMALPTSHTNQDLVVFDESQKILWSGDLVFHEHTPVVDGSLLGWQTVMERLAKIPATHLIPGHGGPWLPWPEGATDQIRYLNKLATDLRRIISNGGTMLEAQKQAAKEEEEKWKLFEEFNPRNASAAFAELEWE